MVSDAGPDGYGYKIEGKSSLSRQLTFQSQCVAEAAEWTGDAKDMWQAWRELCGIKECIRAEGPLLTGKSVLVLSDAVGAVKYVNNGAGRPERGDDLYHEEDLQAVREDGDLS